MIKFIALLIILLQILGKDLFNYETFEKELVLDFCSAPKCGCKVKCPLKDLKNKIDCKKLLKEGIPINDAPFSIENNFIYFPAIVIYHLL